MSWEVFMTEISANFSPVGVKSIERGVTLICAAKAKEVNPPKMHEKINFFIANQTLQSKKWGEYTKNFGLLIFGENCQKFSYSRRLERFGE
jgi:hypothetical protein